MTLTDDQRWLLLTAGPNITDALVSDDGRERLRSAVFGGTGWRVDGAPEWMTSYWCSGGKLTSPDRGGDIRVTVTVAQLARFAADELPAPILAELRDVLHAKRAESERTRKWCRCAHPEECSRSNEGDPLWGGRYHPTDAEDDEHLAIVHALMDRERAALRAALTPTPPAQLDLFAESLRGAS